MVMSPHFHTFEMTAKETKQNKKQKQKQRQNQKQTNKKNNLTQSNISNSLKFFFRCSDIFQNVNNYKV